MYKVGTLCQQSSEKQHRDIMEDERVRGNTQKTHDEGEKHMRSGGWKWEKQTYLIWYIRYSYS